MIYVSAFPMMSLLNSWRSGRQKKLRDEDLDDDSDFWTDFWADCQIPSFIYSPFIISMNSKTCNIHHKIKVAFYWILTMIIMPKGTLKRVWKRQNIYEHIGTKGNMSIRKLKWNRTKWNWYSCFSHTWL